MALELKGKTTLVTGVGSGICLAVAKRLVSSGYNVLAVDLMLSPDAERELHAAENSAKAVHVETDVTEWGQLQRAFDAAMSSFGGLDIVCPGAGVFEPEMSSYWHPDTGADTVASSSYESIEMNLMQPIRATQLAIDYFLRQKLGHGAVLLASSIAAQMPLLPTPLYPAGKHVISGFTRSLAHLEEDINIHAQRYRVRSRQTPDLVREQSSTPSQK